MQGPSGLRTRLNNPLIQSIGLFVAALLPRLAALGRYVTPDEPIWVYRSINFREALLAADWAATIQSGHPGVVVTWLGAISVQLQLWLQPQSRSHLAWLDQLYWLSPANGPAFQQLSAFLTVARLGPIILTSLGIVAVYWLARPRVGRGTAVIGAMLLAADPFTAGLSGLFHLDALLSTFMLLAVLCMLPKSEQAPTAITRREAILSGLFTALAILTKTPGLFLLPFISLLILWRTLFGITTGLSLAARLRSLPAPFLYWGGTILIVIFLLLPAVWAAPVTVFETISGLTNRLADSAVRPIFFLGEETLSPGPAFYPLVMVFRLSPVVVIGLLLAAVFTVKRFGELLKTKLFERLSKSLYSNYIWLLLFGLTFLFFLNLSAKRFDRYALPAILPLILISAAGFKTAAAKIKSPTLSQGIIPFFIGAQLLYLISALPFPLQAYNWLVGGPTTAQNVFVIGWGEETSSAARRLAEDAATHPDAALFTNNIPAAAAFYPGPLLPLNAQTLSRLQPDDFVHFLPQDWQTDSSPEQALTLFTVAKDYFIQEHGITDLTQDSVFTNLEPADFRLPTFQSTPQQIHFAGQIAIRSAGALREAWPNPIQVGIEWQRLQPSETDYSYRLELVDQAGETWLTLENPLLNGVDHLVRYWPANEAQQVFYNFLPPSDLTPGTYTIQAALFDEKGAQLGVFTDDGRFAGVKASLVTFTIPPPIAQLPPEPTNPLNSNTEFIGYGTVPARVETGLPLKLDVWWRQMAQTAEAGNLQLIVGDETADYVLSTSSWVTNQYYHIRPVWKVPTSLESGSYSLSLQFLDEDGRAQWPAPIEVGRLEIVARPRSFDLPDGIEPLEIQLGSVAYLQQVQAEVTESGINLNVIWQAIEPDGVFYTTFVHLIDESGNPVTQGDRPSLEPTNSWVSGQVIQEQYRLARPPSGRYTIAIGLYQPTNGLRLPVYGADGTILPNEQYVLEVVVP